MKKGILIPMIVMLVAVPGAAYFMGYLPLSMGSDVSAASEQGQVDSHGEAIAYSGSIYLPLNPPFVVNFSHMGQLRYLQISLELMYHDQALIDQATQEMPAIRNELILMLSDQSYEKLASLEGKQELREEMMAAINAVVFGSQVAPGTGEIYITNFVMQ